MTATIYRALGAPFAIAILVSLAVGSIASFADDYVLYVLSLCCVYIVFAIGYNILLGCAGQLDFGQAGFLGIGAYTIGILQNSFGINFWLALPAAGLIACFMGLVIGAVVLRLQGFYLALVTLGFSQTVVLVISLSGSVTGGYQGLSIEQPTLPGLMPGFALFVIVLAITALMAGAAANLLKSRIGLAFFALKENDIAAEAMGINVTRYRMMAYAVSAFYGGIAGGLMAAVLSYITPDAFGILETVKVLTMVTVGGMGSILGSVLGAVILTLSSELLRFSSAFLEIGNGLFLVLAIMFMPDGIAGLFGAIKMRRLDATRRHAPKEVRST